MLWPPDAVWPVRTMAAKKAQVLNDIFEVLEIDPDGKKFDKGVCCTRDDPFPPLCKQMILASRGPLRTVDSHMLHHPPSISNPPALTKTPSSQ